jgi:deoxyribonuclease V
MFACVDVDYRQDGSAFAACLLFDTWSADRPHDSRIVRIDSVGVYAPGEFFRRELPCVLRVLAEVGVELDAVLVDGYVTLDPEGRPGLGARLYEALQRATPVIGVAKTRYAKATTAIPLLRGKSRVPLWITSAGIVAEQAALIVLSMHGPHRIPTLLRQVDRLARDAN